MNLNWGRVFKSLVIGQWVVIILVVLISSSLESDLPAPLRAYLEEDLQRDLTVWGVLSIPLLLCHIVASAGLYLFKWWARNLYSATVLLFILLPSGPQVLSSIESALNDLVSIIEGMLLVLMWATPLANSFKRPVPNADALHVHTEQTEGAQYSTQIDTALARSAPSETPTNRPTSTSDGKDRQAEVSNSSLGKGVAVGLIALLAVGAKEFHLAKRATKGIFSMR